MEQNPTAKEAIWRELQPLMEKQLSEGPLSEEELHQMERLSAALNALGSPHLDARSRSILNAFQQLALLRMIQEDSRKELRRLSLLLERSVHRQKSSKMGIGCVLGLFSLWFGLSLLLLLTIHDLDDFIVQLLFSGSISAAVLAIFVFERRSEWNRTDWTDIGEEDDEWR